MIHLPNEATLGVLVSGGLDSGVLLGHALHRGLAVQPLYVRCGLRWETAEEALLRQFLAAVAKTTLLPLKTFDVSVADVYAPHWSLAGPGVPDAATPDEAVYLPGRNLLLLVKAALWCALNDVRHLALGLLASNPFEDARHDFFESFQHCVQRATGGKVEILRPFYQASKTEVMQLGRNLPLELTFSCLAPQGCAHCGACNKCAERQTAFRRAGLADPTHYAAAPACNVSPPTTVFCQE